MGEYVVTRSISVAAPPERVHALVDDFHAWRAWSPWEDLDPNVHRVFRGPDTGPGAHYAWRGNRKAGEGSMEIVAETPDRVEVAVRFHKPFSAASTAVFDLTPAGDGTAVSWTMRGQTPGGVAGLISKVIPMDRWIGKDFEKGLARLKAAAEAA